MSIYAKPPKIGSPRSSSETAPDRDSASHRESNESRWSGYFSETSPNRILHIRALVDTIFVGIDEGRLGSSCDKASTTFSAEALGYQEAALAERRLIIATLGQENLAPLKASAAFLYWCGGLDDLRRFCEIADLHQADRTYLLPLVDQASYEACLCEAPNSMAGEEVAALVGRLADVDSVLAATWNEPVYDLVFTREPDSGPPAAWKRFLAASSDPVLDDDHQRCGYNSELGLWAYQLVRSLKKCGFLVRIKALDLLSDDSTDHILSTSARDILSEILIVEQGVVL